MAFPRNDYQPPSGLALIPPVVKNLLIINGLVFLAQQIPVLAEPLAAYGMLWPAGTPDVYPQNGALARVPDFWPWQLITSAFMHGGLGHIFFNMFGLWMFGGVVEQTLGSKRFLWFYAACVIGASLLQLLVTSAPFWMGELPYPVPTLGASGGVLGVLAAFAVLYPDQKIFLLFLPVPIPAKWFVLGYALIDLFSGVAGTASGIAHFAHLGGMLTGFLLLQYWRGRLPIKPAARSL
ncbi:MAG: rhomboid family intramembrane serine protease [Bacteroidota bacterium]